jgi:hypothetical protein
MLNPNPRAIAQLPSAVTLAPRRDLILRYHMVDRAR